MLARATVVKLTLIGLLFFGLAFLILNSISFKHQQWTTRMIDPQPMVYPVKIKSNPVKTFIRRYRISLKHNQVIRRII